MATYQEAIEYCKESFRHRAYNVNDKIYIFVENNTAYYLITGEKYPPANQNVDEWRLV